MMIADYLKTSFIDYKDHVASVVFTSECNFNCPYCHNKELMSSNSCVAVADVFKHLKKRKNILDGIVITGGEPTLQTGLTSFLQDVKSLGYDIKLDTNGYRPDVVQRLLEMELVDYIAMDIKNVSHKYTSTIGKEIDIVKIHQTMSILKSSSIDYEFRTTMMKDFHSDVEALFEMVSHSKRFVMQQYRYSEDQIVDLKFQYFTLEEMHGFRNQLKDRYNIDEIIVKGRY